MTGPGNAERQRTVRRYGASLVLIALALLISRYVTPSGASSPLVLLGATAAVARFGGKWPALVATLVAAAVNAGGIGLGDWPRSAVESSMILFIGSILSFRIPSPEVPTAERSEAIQGEAYVTGSEALSVLDPPRQPTGEPPRAVDAGGCTQEVQTTARPNPRLVPAESTAPTVLVIHGNAVLRLALRSTLSGLGYRVSDLANAASATQVFAVEPPAGVVVDIGRVDDSALGVVEQIRAAVDKSFLLVLATADSEDDRELVLAAGADTVLPKPVDTSSVASVLRERLPLRDGIQSRVGLGASP